MARQSGHEGLRRSSSHRQTQCPAETLHNCPQTLFLLFKSWPGIELGQRKPCPSVSDVSRWWERGPRHRHVVVPWGASGGRRHPLGSACVLQLCAQGLMSTREVDLTLIPICLVKNRRLEKLDDAQWEQGIRIFKMSVSAAFHPHSTLK